MSKMPAILSATLTASLVACGGGGSDTRPIGLPVTTPLVTPDAKTTGTVTVFNSTDGLFVTAAADAGWELRETRLAVARSLDGIPHCKSGEPQPERFLLRKSGGPGTTQLGYNLPLLVEPGTELFIALYARVRPATSGPGDEDPRAEAPPGTTQAHDDGHPGEGDEDAGETPAWAQGLLFPGKDVAMYLTYVVRAPGPPSLAGKYRTYPQSAWGAAPGSNPASSYLAANFMVLYPGGLTIGSSLGDTVRFLDLQSLDAFLPESGTATSLAQSYVNPPNLANPFAGEIVALTLNLAFDASNASTGQVPLASLLVADPASPLYGLSVGEVLTNANLLLGNATASNAMLADTYDAVSRINANFENGTADLGFLGLP
jgi:hypothetical protein